jgi:hypothetical protein
VGGGLEDPREGHSAPWQRSRLLGRGWREWDERPAERPGGCGQAGFRGEKVHARDAVQCSSTDATLPRPIGGEPEQVQAVVDIVNNPHPARDERIAKHVVGATGVDERGQVVSMYGSHGRDECEHLFEEQASSLHAEAGKFRWEIWIWILGHVNAQKRPQLFSRGDKGDGSPRARAVALQRYAWANEGHLPDIIHKNAADNGMHELLESKVYTAAKTSNNKGGGTAREGRRAS